MLDDASAAASTFVTAAAYAPDRLPVRGASDARDERAYFGKPLSVGVGTVPVTWTNRWVLSGPATTVHRAGDYWIAVGLGPDAAQLARNTAVGVILRVDVTGTELAGPQYRAPALAAGDGGKNAPGDASGAPGGSSGPATTGRSDASASGSGGSGSGLTQVTGTDLAAAGTGGAVALAGIGAVALARRGRTGPRTSGGYGSPGGTSGFSGSSTSSTSRTVNDAGTDYRGGA